MKQFVRKVGIGGWECEGCGRRFQTREEAEEHVRACQQVGYLIDAEMGGHLISQTDLRKTPVRSRW